MITSFCSYVNITDCAICFLYIGQQAPPRSPVIAFLLKNLGQYLRQMGGKLRRQVL